MKRFIPVFLFAPILIIVFDATRSNSREKQTMAGLPAEQVDTNGLRYFNSGVMNRSYFAAYSSPATNQRSNGWYVSENIPRPVKKNSLFPSGQLSILIDTSEVKPFAEKFYGYPVYIANLMNDTAMLEAQDSRLYMKVQALNKKGDWQDIEYVPNSTCGNSYHEVQLEPGSYWQFVMPVYNGRIKTKLRIQLITAGVRKKTTETILYSNVINGSINEGQFSNKGTYQPGGIMDPYND